MDKIMILFLAIIILAAGLQATPIPDKKFKKETVGMIAGSTITARQHKLSNLAGVRGNFECSRTNSNDVTFKHGSRSIVTRNGGIHRTPDHQRPNYGKHRFHHGFHPGETMKTPGQKLFPNLARNTDKGTNYNKRISNFGLKFPRKRWIVQRNTEKEVNNHQEKRKDGFKIPKTFRNCRGR